MPTTSASNTCRLSPPVSQQPLGDPPPGSTSQSFDGSYMPLVQSSHPSLSLSPHWCGSSGNGSAESSTPSPSLSPPPPPPPPVVHCASNSAFKNSRVPWL